jgi:16S rRNA processing protein RimM
LKSSNSLHDRDDLILVGRVVGAHGVKGNLKVNNYAESLSVYEAEAGLQVGLPDGSVRTLTVRWVQPHGRGLLMNVETVTDRNQAETLIGAQLFADKGCLPELEEDTYYWFDLVGLDVVNTNGVRLGRLDGVIPTDANDVYVVKSEHHGRQRELLIPAVGNVVLEIDLDSGTMIVDPPDGL